MLEELRRVAFTFKLEQLNTPDQATSLDLLINVLTGIKKSYTGYLTSIVESNHQLLSGLTEKIRHEKIENWVKTQDLLVVDLGFGSAIVSTAPPIADPSQTTLFENSSFNSIENFNNFKIDILNGDFENPHYIADTKKRFSEKERKLIFGPLFEAAGGGKNYRLHIYQDSSVTRTIFRPNPEYVPLYLGLGAVDRKSKKQYVTAKVWTQIDPETNKIHGKPYSLEISEIADSYP